MGGMRGEGSYRKYERRRGYERYEKRIEYGRYHDRKKECGSIERYERNGV